MFQHTKMRKQKLTKTKKSFCTDISFVLQELMLCVHVQHLLCCDTGSNTDTINKMMFFVMTMFFMKVTLHTEVMFLT